VVATPGGKVALAGVVEFRGALLGEVVAPGAKGFVFVAKEVAPGAKGVVTPGAAVVSPGAKEVSPGAIGVSPGTAGVVSPPAAGAAVSPGPEAHVIVG
jgi:hypothetical protein